MGVMSPAAIALASALLAVALTVDAADLSSPANLRDGLAVASPRGAGLKVAPLVELKDAVARGDYPKTASVLVVRDGRLVYEEYFGDGGRDVLNDTRSATKSITSLAIGVAIGSGAISSQRAQAFHYLDGLRPFQNDGPDKEAITIEDLLTMSSALDCNDDDDKSPGNEDNMHPQPNWSRWAVDLPTMEGYRRDSSGLGPWRYCTTGSFLLGQILQHATHTRADQYIEKRILAPLGITEWEWPYSPSNETMTGGGLRLRSRDLAKIAAVLIDGGRWKGRQVVPKSWVDSALSIHRKAYSDSSYGYLLWQRDYDTPCGSKSGWYMAGNGGNAIVMFRDLRTAVVVTRTNYNTRGMHQQTIDLLQRYVLPAIPCTSSRHGEARK
jgi:CubicO group peptidase (beta-lactamase class C family)